MSVRTLRHQSGQTLIIALLILGVLLVLGVVFAGIVNRGIIQTGAAFRRTQSGDLAEAGIRFAHAQLQFSSLGADWRPTATPPPADAGGFSRDPDALFLRPAPATSFLRDRLGNPIPDRGGPDGLGPYSRVVFDRGRALLRVRYAAGQLSNFSGLTNLRQPGRARNYIVLESIGRPGQVVPNDPTTQGREGARITGYTSAVDFDTELRKLAAMSNQVVESRRQVAFASVGILEQSWFITNKFKVSRPAEIGCLTNRPLSGALTTESEAGGIAVNYEGQAVQIPTLLGGTNVPLGPVTVRGTGSFFSNADVVVHGLVETTLDPATGDAFSVAGTIRPANRLSELRVNRIVSGLPVTTSLTNATLTSQNPAFNTVNGTVRDGVGGLDNQGFPRAVGRREPPSFFAVDPSTGVNRYAQLTRDSGTTLNGPNSGRFGHGRGVYIDSRDRANLPSEVDREIAGAVRSLVQDWLTPNNPNSVAWKGPFYIPVATSIELRSDGFVITRDSRSNQRFWRRANGQPTVTSSVRFRLVPEPAGLRTIIINSLNNPALIDESATNLQANFSTVAAQGQEFNGLLYVEGDVRIRGVIPTNQQLTLVSGGSIYIEGSITKGVRAFDGTMLGAPSRSTLMLAARDYTVVNTTMFFGPAVGEVVNSKRVAALANTPNPVELDLNDRTSLTVSAQFPLDNVPSQAGFPTPAPNSWEPFVRSYREAGDNQPIETQMLLTHSADDNGPSFIRLFTTARGRSAPGDPQNVAYQFFRSIGFNSAMNDLFAPGPTHVPLYGLTEPRINAYPRFETVALPLVSAAVSAFSGSQINVTGAWGNHLFTTEGENDLRIQLASVGTLAAKNYALARVGMQPFDVVIEAALYAEEGSFFVIPGPTFNMNPEDTREKFYADVATFGGIGSAQDRRYEDFGNLPATPFFGEPLNVRITLRGAVSENMPAAIDQRSEWLRRWGWMPRTIGGAGSGPSLAGLTQAPSQHVPPAWTLDTNLTGSPGTTPRYLPNLTLTYDPVFSFGSADGTNPIRRSPDGLWDLPPMPRLPVSPTLAFFGETNL